MTPLGAIVLGAGALAVVGGLLWYLLITTEGVYLGRRVVVWLYDVYARRYDNIKKYDRDWEAITLGEPVLQALIEVEKPLILDVATGTARLPLTLLDSAGFDGQIIGLDYSRRMLDVAAEKLSKEYPQAPVTFIHANAEALPFEDSSFDVVTCLEALEFMPNQDVVLGEIVRVARPGALILLTNRKGSGARLMPFKTQKADRLIQRLREKFGLIDVEAQIWQVDYEQIWAFKPGDLEPILENAHELGKPVVEAVLRCPVCGQRQLRYHGSDQLVCQNCQSGIQIGADGVINYHTIPATKIVVESK